MTTVYLQGTPVVYDTVGDGFPLLLLPGPPGVWEPTLALLGELCRVITYTAPLPMPEGLGAVALVEALMQALGLERCYVASQVPSWPLALEVTLRCAHRVEGVVLVGTHTVEADVQQHLTTLVPRLPTVSVPTALLMTAEVRTTSPVVERLRTHLPRNTTQVLAGPAASGDVQGLALHIGHAMSAFLVQCERQRTLVRGASFLL